MELIHSRSDNVLTAAEILISDVVPSTESQRAYRRAIRELIDWYEHRGEKTFDKATVHRYRSYLVSRNLSPASINQKLSAIRTLATELADSGRLSATTAAAIVRVRGVRNQGVRTGNWLECAEAQRLLEAPSQATLRGKRDTAVIGVTVGCGLRRTELASLTIEHLQLRSNRWMVVDIRGKHGRVRSVPMPDWAKELVDAWVRAAGVTSGCIFRAVDKKGRVHGHGLSAQSVYDIVRGNGIDVGLRVAPHDLRRSFARLAHAGHSPLEQIQMSLGHSSVATTERYIGARQNLKDAPCDRLGIYLPLMLRIEEDIEDPWVRMTSGSRNRLVLRATGFMPVFAAARVHEGSTVWF